MTTSSGTYTTAPNRPSCETPRNPMMSPISRLAALVTGSASAPIACISRGNDAQSTERGDDEGLRDGGGDVTDEIQRAGQDGWHTGGDGPEAGERPTSVRLRTGAPWSVARDRG